MTKLTYDHMLGGLWTIFIWPHCHPPPKSIKVSMMLMGVDLTNYESVLLFHQIPTEGIV